MFASREELFEGHTARSGLCKHLGMPDVEAQRRCSQAGGVSKRMLHGGRSPDQVKQSAIAFLNSALVRPADELHSACRDFQVPWRCQVIV